MSLILNIDTATQTANVSISENGTIIEGLENTVQKDHAAFLHPAIAHLMQKAGKAMGELDAVAVTAGPGSYTGIRVGMASAKGLCTALNKPFITINTLELLAKDAITHYDGKENDLFCPMIDARRMEVYTAIYDRSLKEILKPSAMILDHNSFHEFDGKYTLINFGNGSDKWKRVVKVRNSVFIENVNIGVAMALLSSQRYVDKTFTDLTYSEPLYLKEFYNGA